MRDGISSLKTRPFDMTSRDIQSSSGAQNESGMESRLGPSEVTMYSQPPELAGLSDPQLVLSPSYPSDRSLLEVDGRQLDPVRSQTPIKQWWDAIDGPWDPQCLKPPQGVGRVKPSVDVLGLGSAYDFGQYRDSYVLSEYDSIPPGMPLSDSGYGSNGAKASVAADSVYGEPPEQYLDAQNLVGNLGQFHIYGGEVTHSRFPNSWGTQMQPPMIQVSNQMDEKTLVCDVCQKALKTPSELK